MKTKKGIGVATAVSVLFVISAAACGGREPVYVKDSAEIPEDARRYAGRSGYPRVVEAGTDEECPTQRDTVTIDLTVDRQNALEDPGAESPPQPCIRAADREREELIALARGPQESEESSATEGSQPGGELSDQGGPTVLATFEGRASYYSDSLSGRRTANGERYDPNLFTAASRDLPFDTVVRVTRLDTLDQVVVRINDRGPFGDRRRILDLSRAAATRIDMIRAGVVNIRAEVIAMPAD